MKIYDADYNEIKDPDLSKGRLEYTRRLIKHHKATKSKPAEYAMKVLEGTLDLYPGGLKQMVITKPEVLGKEAWDEFEECQIYYPFTEDELNERNQPTEYDKLQAQVLYTAMMTDTLIDKSRTDEVLNTISKGLWPDTVIKSMLDKSTTSVKAYKDALSKALNL